jgi:hypothetical protein
MRRAGLFLFLAGISALAQDQSTATGGIRGIVTDSVSRQPVRKATVSLQFLALPSNPPAAAASPGAAPAAPDAQNRATPVAPAQQGRIETSSSTTLTPGGVIFTGQQPQTAVSDAGGNFAMDQVQPGRYRLTVFHEKYPKNRFGPAPTGKIFTVNAGETAGPLTVELIPGAAISGRIVDEDGDPLTGCNPRLQPLKHPEQNVMALPGAPGSNADEGTYRLYGIAPGKYLLGVQCQMLVFQPRPLSAGPDPPPASGYPLQYYPASGTVEGAEVIDLAAGMERQGLDFRMKPAPVTTVQMKLTGAEWRGRRDLGWRLTSDASVGQGFLNRGGQVDPAKDTVLINGVFPGSYTLQVSVNGFSPNQSGGPMVAGTQRVEVKDKPVQVTLELRQGVDVAGIVQLDSAGAPSAPTTFSMRQVNIQLSQNTVFGPRGGSTPVQEDGTFIIKSAVPLPSRLMVTAPGAFMKSAWLGNVELTGGMIDPGLGGGPLRIVVSTNLASINGTAPPGAQIMAISVDTPSGGGRGTQADANGQFKMIGLAPGKYRVVAIDQPGPSPDEGGQEITLQEGETRTLELKAER